MVPRSLVDVEIMMQRARTLSISLALAAVIAQQLVPGVDGVTRWPATEIMIATDAIRALIRKGDDHQLRSQISTGRAEGVMTMEQSLAELVRSGRIDRDIAFAHCFRTDDLKPPPFEGEDLQGSDAAGWSYRGRNLHFGVREHAMGALVNGIAAHGGLVPFGAGLITLRLALHLIAHVVSLATGRSVIALPASHAAGETFE